MDTSASAHKARRTTLLGVVFLMVIGAIGPGLLTQTAIFTVKLGTVFAFAILISMLLGIMIQLSVWRVIAVPGHRVQELGNAVLPGLGWLMSVPIVIGSVISNIGNIDGAGLGANTMLGVDVKTDGIIIAIFITSFFFSRRAGMALDKTLAVLSVVMTLVTGVVAFSSSPPIGKALKNTVISDTIDLLTIIMLVGGTAGGYIAYVSARHVLDTGAGGVENLAQTTRLSVMSTIVTAIIRFPLFLAVLGIAMGGAVLNMGGNPAAEAFQVAADGWGMRFFGIVLWAAEVSSIVGTSYTSVTFLIHSSGAGAKTQNAIITVLIAISTLLFGAIGATPATLLVFAGAFNGLVLPIGVTVLTYIVLFYTDLINGYKYSKWLAAIGIVGVAVAWFLVWCLFGGMFEIFG